MVERTSSIATVLNGPVRSCAAVTTTGSTGPQARNSFATLSSLVTSAGIAIAFNLSAAASSRSTFRDAMMTSAPARLAISAVDRPMPEEPPTTTTFFPASSIRFPLVRSGGLVAGADARLALSKPGQFPNAGADRIHIGSDIDLDQIGRVGGDALADGLPEI